MTTATQIAAGSYRLTGIVKTAGECEACSREITQRVFVVANAAGAELGLGRRCAAKATGYAANAVEREAARAARLAEVNRRYAIIAAEFPHVDDDLRMVAATEDAWWGGRGNSRGTWQEYLAHHSAQRG